MKLISLSALALLLLPGIALAYPPAPYHLIYGLVRDEYGTPIASADAHVLLTTANRGPIEAELIPGIAPGINYQLKVPMDAGLTPIAHGPTALIANAPFKLFVVMGGVTNTPIQMTGDASQLGQPGQTSHIDLTLGSDTNGDGIPDSWEYAVLAGLGSNLTLSQLNARSVLTADGHTLGQLFLMGGNPLASGAAQVNSLTVGLAGIDSTGTFLEFSTTSGQTYTVLSSADLQQWTPSSFTVPADGPSGPTYFTYAATSQQTIQVRLLFPSPQPRAQFFKIEQK